MGPHRLAATASIVEAALYKAYSETYTTCDASGTCVSVGVLYVTASAYYFCGEY
jgi:hypothetical protein